MSHIWTMIAKRLALGVVTLFVVSLLIFLGTELLPGDFAQEILGQSATPETVAALRERRRRKADLHQAGERETVRRYAWPTAA